jgi:peptidoglycan/LPS O-acetylase OafA/YrhL
MLWGQASTTIGDRLDQSRGFARGFDAARLLFALLVVAFHSVWVAVPNTTLGLDRSTWFPAHTIVPGFFALSGFLIAGSAWRLSLGNFIINRGLRIFPALVIEVVASAFILGLIFTALPRMEYLTHPQTWKYLTNLVGWFNYSLPGVFLDHPSAGMVNMSLWTIPWEVLCYGLICVLIATGLIRRRMSGALLTGLFVAAGVLCQAFNLDELQGVAGDMVRAVFFGPGPTLITFFLASITAYQWRHSIPFHPALFAAAVLACGLAAALTPLGWTKTPMMAVVTCLPIVYIVVFIGVTDMPKLPFFSRGDYSYGIYLYGYPIQQAVKALFPGITDPVLLTAVALPPIILFAAFSWHWVEKPVLRFRQRFSFIASTRLGPDEHTAISPTPAAQRSAV